MSALSYKSSSDHVALTSSFFFILLIIFPVVKSTEFTPFPTGWWLAAGVDADNFSQNNLRSGTDIRGFLTLNGRTLGGGGVYSSMISSSSEPSTRSGSSLARPLPLFDADELYSVGRVAKI